MSVQDEPEAPHVAQRIATEFRPSEGTAQRVGVNAQVVHGRCVVCNARSNVCVKVKRVR